MVGGEAAVAPVELLRSTKRRDALMRAGVGLPLPFADRTGPLPAAVAVVVCGVVTAEGVAGCAMAASSMDTSRLSVRERLAVMGMVCRSSQHVEEAGAVEGGKRRNVTVFTASLPSAIVACSSMMLLLVLFSFHNVEAVAFG